MGTWGYKTFEDDTACDWLFDLEAEGTDLLQRSLSPKTTGDDVLDVDSGVGILAAAEIIYGVLNGPREGLPDGAVNWIHANKNADVACLKPLCEGQLGRVLSDQSELRQLWEENAEDFENWKTNVESLRDALKD
jgi:hypothetical protein